MISSALEADIIFAEAGKTMVQLVLLRPGSTDYDSQGRIQGNLDIPLNEKGREQAAAAVECLKGRSLVALYSAAGRAAEETAELIGAALKLRPKTIERLENLNHGLWQGMLIDEVKRKQPKVYKQWQEHPENVCPPEGEMLAEVTQRVDAALEKLLRKHRFGAIGLVASEPLASVIRSRVLGGRIGDLWKAINGCSRVEVFEVQPQLPKAREPHFEPAAVAAQGTPTQAETRADPPSGIKPPEVSATQNVTARAK